MKKPIRKRKVTKAPKKHRKPSSRPSGASAAGRPPERTLEEAKYLKHLVEQKIPVSIRLRSNEEFTGTVEYYDSSFIRLTRESEPNLFIYKHDVKYLFEKPISSS